MKTTKMIACAILAGGVYAGYRVFDAISTSIEVRDDLYAARQTFITKCDSIVAKNKAVMHTIFCEYQMASYKVQTNKNMNANEKQAAIRQLQKRRNARLDSLEKNTNQTLTDEYYKAKRILAEKDSIAQSKWNAILPQKLMRSLSR